MRTREISGFLTHLAVEDQVSVSTQNQALSALLFLYRNVLMLNLSWLNEVVRAVPSRHLPVVLTRQKVRHCWRGPMVVRAAAAFAVRHLHSG
ncbi:phage integrase N-terminal SAM-like domain-containing protein [Chromobacterium vaccinii]|uniref:phage integrase N-terminal SAM-like domain-containing protein n=1 Tax=Chromobacterium vaccinii TaxID=1108595 RepID=UPI0018F8881A|nr:phage integrase N-terminal SAM-like domain-containing protein [Chromobacterium vaccinii]